MLIKMLCNQMGPRVSRYAGQVYDVEHKEAERMVNAGLAVKVEEHRKAVKEPARKAVSQ